MTNHTIFIILHLITKPFPDDIILNILDNRRVDPSEKFLAQLHLLTHFHKLIRRRPNVVLPHPITTENLGLLIIWIWLHLLLYNHSFPLFDGTSAWRPAAFSLARFGCLRLLIFLFFLLLREILGMLLFFLLVAFGPQRVFDLFGLFGDGDSSHLLEGVEHTKPWDGDLEHIFVFFDVILVGDIFAQWVLDHQQKFLSWRVVDGSNDFVQKVNLISCNICS